MQRLFLVLTSFLMVGLQPACSQQSNSTTTASNQEDAAKTDLALADFYTRWVGSGARLVDVRSPEEYASGHAAAAININFFDSDFVQQFSEQNDKNTAVYIYCASGNRSGKAKAALENAGFTKVYNLTGAGFKQWAAAGYPVE